MTSGNTRRRLMKTSLRSKRVAQVAVALVFAAMLGGCSSVVDNMPAGLGGMPDGVPQRPASPAAYPAVHDLPRARQENALNEVESKRLRDELKDVRNRIAPAEASRTGSSAAGSARNP
jgi:hypothetical protein